MCDYSLHAVASRPAKIGDRLITSGFSGTPSRGFCTIGEPGVAVCVRPGTELAFDKDVRVRGWLFPKNTRQRTAVFRQINELQPHAYHDALEFADGQVVLLTELCRGQRAAVLQVPAEHHARAKEMSEVSAVILQPAERPLT